MNPPQITSVLEKELVELLADGPRRVVRALPHGAAVVGGRRNHEWEVDVVLREGTTTITVTGASPDVRRALRNALIGKAALRSDPQEHHVLEQVTAAASPSRRDVVAAARLAARWVRWIGPAARCTPVEGAKAPALADDQLAVYWWDERANFGDAVGPWLVQKISGAQPVNARRRRMLKPALYGVGSIVGYVDRDDVDIWGSGLMKPLTESQLRSLRQRRDVRVHAVRGARTREELVSQLGWEVPEVYGDPALLLPLFYTPRPLPEPASVAFVPHYVHRTYTRGIARPGVTVVEVAEDLERVIDQIAGADVCVSTSLQGAIIAQAYGVPWLWLRVEDHPLDGDTFKFGDFFSTLDESSVAQRDVSSADLASLDLTELAAEASLPQLRISLDELLAAFPVAAGAPAGRSFELPSLPRRALRPFARTRSRLGGITRRLGARRSAPAPVTAPAPSPVPEAGPVALDELVTAVRATTTAVDSVVRELKEHRRLIDALRLAASADTMTEVQEFANARQATTLETLRRLATTDCSFARFGDGEFRLMLRGDFNLRFQRNSPELQRDLLEVFQGVGEPGLEVGFPQVFRDAHWTGVWSELWPQLRSRLPETGTYLNSHVTRPTTFAFLGDEAVQLWRQVWAGKHVVVITGDGSRFEADPALFSSAASTTLVSSTATHAYADLDRVVDAVTSSTSYDIALIALGPAGTVLAHRLHRAGVRALDIGHLSDSYQNVFSGKPRPEAKAVTR